MSHTELDPHFLWRPAEAGFEIGFFKRNRWNLIQRCASRTEAVTKVHALWNERATRVRHSRIAEAEFLAQSSITTIPEELPDQRRCQLSKEGRRCTKENRSGGIIIGESKNGANYRVLWDGLKSPMSYAKSFIEEL